LVFDVAFNLHYLVIFTFCRSFMMNYDLGVVWLDDLAAKELGVGCYLPVVWEILANTFSFMTFQTSFNIFDCAKVLLFVSLCSFQVLFNKIRALDLEPPICLHLSYAFGMNMCIWEAK
jgi:hypothetical protein